MTTNFTQKEHDMTKHSFVYKRGALVSASMLRPIVKNLQGYNRDDLIFDECGYDRFVSAQHEGA